jgi:hypothetical protein
MLPPRSPYQIGKHLYKSPMASTGNREFAQRQRLEPLNFRVSGSNYLFQAEKLQQVFASTTTLAAAGASIKSVNGIKLSMLVLDVRNDGWCGAGAPRYNVTLIGGDSFYFSFVIYLAPKNQ